MVPSYLFLYLRYLEHVYMLFLLATDISRTKVPFQSAAGDDDGFDMESFIQFSRPYSNSHDWTWSFLGGLFLCSHVLSSARNVMHSTGDLTPPHISRPRLVLVTCNRRMRRSSLTTRKRHRWKQLNLQILYKKLKKCPVRRTFDPMKAMVLTILRHHMWFSQQPCQLRLCEGTPICFARHFERQAILEIL